MPSPGPIGVFDSGVGGLSVLREIRSLLPSEDLLYVADSKYVPYGEKPKAMIEARANAIAEFFVGRGAKAIVVACNTATEMAIESLRARYAFPIVGMEPAVKTAAAQTKSGVVGVLATRGTVFGHRVATLIEQQRERKLRILVEACPELVEHVETGDVDGDGTQRVIAERVGPMLEEGADAIVLGCTHFHFLKNAIQAFAGPSVAVLDSGAAVARHVKTRLADKVALAQEGANGTEEFWTSGDVSVVTPVVRRLWGAGALLRALP